MVYISNNYSMNSKKLSPHSGHSRSTFRAQKCPKISIFPFKNRGWSMIRIKTDFDRFLMVIISLTTFLGFPINLVPPLDPLHLHFGLESAWYFFKRS